MKIAFAIYDINICGGTHKQFLKLLEYAEYQKLDFIVITKKLDYDKTYPGFLKFKDKIKVYDAMDYPKILNHRYIWRLIPYFRKKKLRKMLKGFDIVNVHDNGWTFEFPFLFDKKIYWQVNDLPYCFNVGVNSKAKDNDCKKLERQRIIECSKYVEDFSVNVTKNALRIKECLGRDAHVFYCGVEPVTVERNIEVTFERFKKKKVNLLTSGVFFPYRNYETQIEVLRLLKEDGYDVTLKIIGKPCDLNYSSVIQQLIIENGFSDNVKIEGQVDNDTFKQLHENADIFLFINVDQSWGLAVFEAMSCGLPVLVSNSVGATEILDNNTNAIFVEPKNPVEIKNKLLHLINDKDFYRRISYNAAGFHKEWTWNKAYCSKMINLMLKQ